MGSKYMNMLSTGLIPSKNLPALGKGKAMDQQPFQTDEKKKLRKPGELGATEIGSAILPFRSKRQKYDE